MMKRLGLMGLIKLFFFLLLVIVIAGEALGND